MTINNITWDSKSFLERLHTEGTEFRNHKRMLAEVFQNTAHICRQGWYVTESGKKVELNEAKMLCGTIFYERPFSLQIGESYDTEISVVNADCMLVAEELAYEGYNVAILNMASRRNPGGGVLTGARAQEETLCRRSNLHRSLYQFAEFAEEYGLEHSVHQYPMDNNHGGIYTPAGTIFRKGEREGYALMDEPYTSAFITVAGVYLQAGRILSPAMCEVVKNKIRTIFRLGATNGNDALVLGALGCGAFHNPPDVVARLFHEVLLEGPFKHRFRKLVFAILDDHNAHHAHNPNGNFFPFKKEFEKGI